MAILASCLLMTGCGYFNRKHIYDIIPPEIITIETRFVKYSGSFDESEGFGLYALSSKTKNEIQEIGLSFFENVEVGKSPRWEFEDWTVRKGPLDYSWIESGRIDGLFDREALSQKGLYTIYSTRDGYTGVVVIPEADLVNAYYTQ